MKTDDLTSARRDLAQCRGTISAACDILGISPDVSKGGNKPELEQAALDKWIREQRDERLKRKEQMELFA